MRAGRSPQEACEIAVRKVNAIAVRRGVHPAKVAFLALNPKGQVGAACTATTAFEYAVARQGKDVELLKAKETGVEAPWNAIRGVRSVGLTRQRGPSLARRANGTHAAARSRCVAAQLPPGRPGWLALGAPGGTFDAPGTLGPAG